MSKRIDPFVMFFVAGLLSVALLAAGFWHTNLWLISIGLLWCVGTALVWLYAQQMMRRSKNGDLDYHDTI